MSQPSSGLVHLWLEHVKSAVHTPLNYSSYAKIAELRSQMV